MRVTLNLAENGIDSLRKGFEALFNWERACYVESDPPAEQALKLKDAIIFTHHGLEILFKAILSKTSELLVIQELDSVSKQAFAEKRIKGLDSIFDTSVAIDLRTVTVRESIDRLKRVCGLEFPRAFERKLDLIVKLRNQVARANLSIDESTVSDAFDQLLDLADRFFLKAFGAEYKTISGYDQLVEAASNVNEAVEDQHRQTKKKTLQVFRKAFDAAGISMGSGESKLVTDINVATKFLDAVFTSDLHFGTDLFSGANSGDVAGVERVGDQTFDVVAQDISHRWRFAFCSMVIWMTMSDDLGSPIILLISDTVDDPIPDSWAYSTSEYKGRHVDGVKFRDSEEVTWDEEKLRAYYLEAEYGESTSRSLDFHATHYLDGGLFCFINVQGLQYSRKIASYLKAGRNDDPKEIEVTVREELKRTVRRRNVEADST